MSLTSLLGFQMSSLDDTKPVSTPEVVPMISKIMEDQLTGPNYLDLSKTIYHYLKSICMASHLYKDPHTDDSKERWLEDDAHLLARGLPQVMCSLLAKDLFVGSLCLWYNP